MSIKNRKTKYQKIILAMTVLLFCLSFNKVSALTISPARIEVNADPGTTISKQITLYNEGQSAQTYYVSYSNFEAQGETGSPLFVEPKGDLGTWMDAGRSYTLQPGETIVVPVSISVPSDAYSGGHFAVVFFGSMPEEDGQVSVGAKTGTLVLLTVNGDVLEAGGLVSFNTKDKKFFYNSLPVYLEYRWKNDGNDRVKPEGSVVIRNMFYIPATRMNANSVSGNILPHSTRLFSLEWIKYKPNKKDVVPTSFFGSYFHTVSYQWKNFALGPYIANLNLIYGTHGEQSSKTTFFFVFPWQLFIIILLVFVIAFFVGKKLLKAHNRRIIKKARLGMNRPDDAHNV